ncbi:hypothetical protein KIMH_15170 [Bombiscardovia apis]|uniref:Uncharacterized protein n=1 Tax=Bombiscardovia apis TaxID=2932182 RepID=A0ABM8BER6_9BIFI|nr:hypothetical protein KIMH_15170 [Bombiscardovia apis]
MKAGITIIHLVNVLRFSDTNVMSAIITNTEETKRVRVPEISMVGENDMIAAAAAAPSQENKTKPFCFDKRTELKTMHTKRENQKR